MSGSPLLVQQTRFERPHSGGDAVVTFTSKEGKNVEVILTDVAQTQLLIAILGGAKGRIIEGHFELTRPPIRATSFSPYVLSNELAGLEIGLENQGAIHLSFDGETYQQLVQAVQGLSSPSKNDPSSGQPQH
ncbi:MAG: hypothetical protein ACO1N8_13415 [Methylophilus sp.]